MILSKEQYMEVVKKIIGEDTTDDSLKLLEDLTDTYNSFNTPATDEWQSKYEDLASKHTDLTNRYKERFFAPSKEEPEEMKLFKPEPEKPVNPDAGTTFEDLLKGE